MTTASPSTISRSSATPATRAALRSRTKPVTRPIRSAAPWLCAARIKPEVNAAGWTCAVVSQEPKRRYTAHVIRNPIDVVAATTRDAARARETAVGGEAAIAPIAADLAGQAGVKREAAPRQRFERRPVAPVERQEPAGFAGRRVRDPGALDHRHLDAAAAQEIRDCGADDAAAANQDTHGSAFSVSSSF